MSPQLFKLLGGKTRTGGICSQVLSAGASDGWDSAGPRARSKQTLRRCPSPQSRSLAQQDGAHTCLVTELQQTLAYIP